MALICFYSLLTLCTVRRTSNVGGRDQINSDISPEVCLNDGKRYFHCMHSFNCFCGFMSFGVTQALYTMLLSLDGRLDVWCFD